MYVIIKDLIIIRIIINKLKKLYIIIKIDIHFIKNNENGGILAKFNIIKK